MENNESTTNIDEQQPNILMFQSHFWGGIGWDYLAPLKRGIPSAEPPKQRAKVALVGFSKLCKDMVNKSSRMMSQCYTEFWDNNKEVSARAREAKSALRKIVFRPYWFNINLQLRPYLFTINL